MMSTGGGRGSTGRGCSIAALIVLACAALLWFMVRTASYSAIYRGVASLLDAYRSPWWLLAVVAAAAALAARLILSARAPRTLLPDPAPDVQLRAEPVGHLTVVVSDRDGAAAADIVLPRNPEAERDISGRFAALAARAASYGGGRERGAQEAGRELHALGRALAEMVLGGERGAAGRLADLPGNHLQLGVQADLAGLPWEHLVPREGGMPLWRLFRVARQLRAPGATRPAAVRPVVPLRLLLVAATSSDETPPSSEEEATAVLELAARRPDVLRVVRKSPRTVDELATLLFEGYDVLHFAGHAVSFHGNTAWVLPGGRRAPVDELAAARPPAIVFANACGTVAGSSCADLGETARLLSQWGVRAYVGTLWDIQDAAAASFARAFYGALIERATLGEAVTAARERVLPDSPLCAANYVLYGDPTLTIGAS
ncbi:MAG: CHAT domain-containing protein [Candidatus Eisenbacteria bacterium]|nr:CHAT domain-containing protein [Candidatus Eisenbacteria bacterium]